MASVVDICNRALQKLGAKRISALTDETPSGRACSLAYPIIRRSEIRKHDWNFAIKRASLAADSPAPTWGRQNSFTLPSDWLRLAPSYPEAFNSNPNVVGVTVAATATFSGMQDWVIEGDRIVTNDVAPLQIRYIADITNVALWDSLFAEVCSTALALEICEELTQSNTKKSDLMIMYKAIVDEAKLTNAIEVAPNDPPPDTWITVRN